MHRSRARSGRKALKELPNNCGNGCTIAGGGGGGGKAAGEKCGFKTVAGMSKKSVPPPAPPVGIEECKIEDGLREEGGGGGDSLDRLLLVQSNLSGVVRQIDELVAQAFKLEDMSKQGKKGS